MYGYYAQTASRNPEARSLVMACIDIAKHTGNAYLEDKGRDILRRFEGPMDPEASIFPFSEIYD